MADALQQFDLLTRRAGPRAQGGSEELHRAQDNPGFEGLTS